MDTNDGEQFVPTTALLTFPFSHFPTCSRDRLEALSSEDGDSGVLNSFVSIRGWYFSLSL